MSPEGRVRRVLAAAARVRDPGDPLHDEAMRKLPDEAGMTAASVERALALCVEHEVSGDDLARLLASVAPARRVHVVLSGNVFVAAVRALALAWASSPAASLRPSRRSRVMAELLVRALDEQGDADGEVSLVDTLSPAPGDCVHAYGSDATLARIAASLPGGVSFWGHGHGFGVAAADGAVPGGLEDDLLLLDQRGCLSPRLLLLVATERQARERLEAFVRGAEALPPGPRAVPERAEVRSYLDTMQAAGEAWERDGFVLGYQHEPPALLLPPGAGALHAVSVATAERARELLAPWARWVTCVGGEGEAAEAAARAAPRARRARAGWMQRPPLDGPVDRRTTCPRADGSPW